MKYFLFSGVNYSALGGVNDLHGEYESIDAAIYAARCIYDRDRLAIQWAHITDESLNICKIIDCEGLFYMYDSKEEYENSLRMQQ